MNESKISMKMYPPIWSIWRMGAVSLMLLSGSAQAAKFLGNWTPLFQGIEHLTAHETDVSYTGETGSRRLAINALRIDLRNPNIAFITTPSNGAADLDTVGQTTANFLTETRTQVAVNANFFSPCCNASGENKDLLSLQISQGVVVSPADNNSVLPNQFQSLALTKDNQAVIKRISPGADVSKYYTAISGRPLLLAAGAIKVPEVPKDAFSNKNPRTAVGISADGSFLTLLTIDGRQPGYSDGATLFETADWLKTLGANQGLNLDGGGSTSMVMADERGQAVTLNQTAGGVQRFNGSNFGVYALPLSAVPEPGSWGLMLAGLLALATAARRRGA